MRIITVVIAFCFPSFILAQYDYIPVFSPLEGDELLLAIQEEYTPLSVMDYGMARDTMFKIIYNENDTIRGIYSGFERYLDPNEDPTTALYLDGGQQSINTEHIYPQSKGASNEPAKSNMHHLFPSRALVNSARGSDPFADINDTNTDNWYYKSQVLNQIPSNNIDLYSEKINGRFEPREQMKGNVARAMFYFYSIYRSQADAQDSDFFDIQKEDLCSWDKQDPVDSQEWDRTFLIANYQDDKVNPFVIDCSLASRLYCEEIADDCRLLEVPEIPTNDFKFKVFPNPTDGNIFIELEGNSLGNGKLIILNIQGKQLYEQFTHTNDRKKKIELKTQLVEGTYFVKFVSASGNLYTQKLIINK